MIDRIGEQNRIEQMRREEKRTEKLKENFPLCVFSDPIITPTYYSEITAAPFSFIDHELLSLSLLSLSLSFSLAVSLSLSLSLYISLSISLSLSLSPSLSRSLSLTLSLSVSLSLSLSLCLSLSLAIFLSPSLYSYHRISAHSGTVKTTHVDIKNVADLADPDHVLEQRDSDRCV